MNERRTPISPEVMEALMREARDERAAALATMLKRLRAPIAAAFSSFFSLAVQRIHPASTSNLF